MPKDLRNPAALFVLMLMLLPGAAAAQVTGSVAGIVRDASGAVLPGVTVTITGAALQRERSSATSGADGTYRIQLVPPGVYDVSADLAGFTPQNRDGGRRRR